MSISNSFNQMEFGILVNSNRTILSIQETCHYQSKQKLIGFEVMGEGRGEDYLLDPAVEISLFMVLAHLLINKHQVTQFTDLLGLDSVHQIYILLYKIRERSENRPILGESKPPCKPVF